MMTMMPLGVLLQLGAAAAVPSSVWSLPAVMMMLSSTVICLACSCSHARHHAHLPYTRIPKPVKHRPAAERLYSVNSWYSSSWMQLGQEESGGGRLRRSQGTGWGVARQGLPRVSAVSVLSVTQLQPVGCGCEQGAGKWEGGTQPGHHRIHPFHPLHSPFHASKRRRPIFIVIERAGAGS